MELFGNELEAGLQLLVRNELFDFVDSNRLVDVAACAFILAVMRTNTTADRGEGVFFLDKLKSVVVVALGSFLYVALNCDVSRAGGLAGGGAGLYNVLAVLAVVGIPLVLTPLGVPGKVRKLMLNGSLCAELLSELNGVVGTVFNALTSGNAVFSLDICFIVAAGSIGRVKILGCAESKAGIGHTVADSN